MSENKKEVINVDDLIVWIGANAQSKESYLFDKLIEFIQNNKQKSIELAEAESIELLQTKSLKLFQARAVLKMIQRWLQRNIDIYNQSRASVIDAPRGYVTIPVSALADCLQEINNIEDGVL